jgi:hypothetical protein
MSHAWHLVTTVNLPSGNCSEFRFPAVCYFRGPRRILTGSGLPYRSSAHGSPRLW